MLYFHLLINCLKYLEKKKISSVIYILNFPKPTYRGLFLLMTVKVS